MAVLGPQTFFIGFGPGHGDTLRELFTLVARSNAIKLVRSREFTLDKAQLKRLWTICGTGKQPGGCGGAGVRCGWCVTHGAWHDGFSGPGVLHRF